MKNRLLSEATGPHCRMFRNSLLMLVIMPAFQLPAADPADAPIFRTHVLNADSEFSACAVFDVDRDGHPDVFSGGYWYEGPGFQRRKVRDVQEIRGRFDDYSNLALDMDRDGWTDVISVNYRSQSIYWVRNPGPQSGPWARQVIAEPGHSETGRLVDLNQDGKADYNKLHPEMGSDLNPAVYADSRRFQIGMSFGF